MLNRVVQLLIRSYVRGPGRSWLYTTVAAFVIRWLQGLFSRKELVDVSSIKPGEMIIIEHLPVSHRQQIKEFKKADRSARKRGRRRPGSVSAGLRGRIRRSGSGRESRTP